MEKIRFITDSASDMNHPREDVTILPLHIRFGDDEYADGVTISHREFYEKLIECDTLPTTSLVSPAVFEDAYEQAVSAGETVIVITISGKLSGTCQSARIAAEDYEGKVFVVDSMNATVEEIRPPFFRYSKVSRSPMVWILDFSFSRMLTISSADFP